MHTPYDTIKLCLLKRTVPMGMCTARSTRDQATVSRSTHHEEHVYCVQVHHEIKLDKDGVKHHTAEMAPALAITGGPETQEMHR